MTDEEIQGSPFYQVEGVAAPGVKAALATLSNSLPVVDAASDALRSGNMTADQRDGLLANMIDLYKLIINLLLGRT